MKREYKYHLEKYHGRASRHTCPACEWPQEFTLYVDEDGNPINENVGKCNRKNNCGYHMTPAQWFKEHPTGNGTDWRHTYSPQPAKRPDDDVKPGYIDHEYVIRSMSIANGLFDYLKPYFSEESLKAAMEAYFVGATKDRATIYWQIDTRGRARTGKVIHYKDDGHRDHEKGANWIHAILKYRKELPKSFNLVQCLFGEHLLTKRPGAVVALVEAEKTAVICSMLCPKYVWVACGSCEEFKASKLAVLRGRKVTAFPDTDAFKKWSDKAAEISRANPGLHIDISDMVERNTTPEQKAKGWDIADILMQAKIDAEIHKKPISDEFRDMMNRNPLVKRLVDALGLVEI